MYNLYRLLAVYGILFFIIFLAICILLITANWKIFTKAGKPGWAALIPFYNVYILSDITFGNSNYFIWYITISVITYIARVFSIGALSTLAGAAFVILQIFFCIKISKAFKKSGGFTVGLVLLPFIFFPILGFSNDEYLGIENNKWERFMSKNKKIILFSYCVAFAITFFLLLLGLRYISWQDIWARNTAKTVLDYDVKKDTPETVKIGKLKYAYTLYNSDVNKYRVTYYATIDDPQNNYKCIEIYVYMNALTMSEEEIGYSYEDIQNYYLSFNKYNDSDGEWVNLDDVKNNKNGFILAFIIVFISGLVVLFKKEKKISNNPSYVFSNDNINDKTPLKSKGNNINKLKELTRMKDEGLITEEEFQAKKKDILDKM